MKKIKDIILILSILISYSIQAQQYYPFPENNAFWLVSWGTPSESSDYHYELTGDTLIGLFNYHKLESAGNTYYSFDPNNPQFYNNGYVGAYRNDTLTKKVYYFPKDSINESLLYDFNMVTGDTIQGFMAQLAKNKFGPTFYAIIDSVDSILLNNSEYRKRWYFHSSDSWGLIWGGGEIIESIGSNYGLIEGLLPMFDDNGQLTCHSKNGISLYGNSPCSLITGIEKSLKIEEISIYPNPVINQLIIGNTNLKITKMTIIDLTGKFVKTIKQNFNTIDVSNLEAGIYFVKLISNKKTIIKKFVKQ